MLKHYLMKLNLITKLFNTPLLLKYILVYSQICISVTVNVLENIYFIV